MKKTFFFSICFLSILGIMILVGCVPANDPYTLMSAGEEAIRRAELQLTSTAGAAIEHEEAAILQQAQTQTSNDNRATETAQGYHLSATGTALYFEAQSTQAAATAQAIATQEAQIVSATRQAFALAELQQGATGTAQVVQTQTAMDFDRQTAQIGREKVVTIAAWIAVFVGVIVALYLAFRFVEWAMKTQTGRRSWVEGAESFAYDNGQGLTVIAPRRMFSPALQLDGKGRITMPQLVAPDLQAATTAGALMVELEREKSKKAQWFTPLGKNGAGESFTQLPDGALPAQLPAPALNPLPMLFGRHVMIVGPTGGGKTYTARYLLQARRSAYILDPHNKPGIWPDGYKIVGGGRRFDEIAQVIRETTTLMTERYKLRAAGTEYFEPVHLVTDEIPAIVRDRPESATDLMLLAREGRKVEIYLILITQSNTVKSLGIEGEGDTRENFATVKVAPLAPGQADDTPRRCTVIIGALNKPESEEAYIVPSLPDRVPTFDHGVPGGVPGVPWMDGEGAGTGSGEVGTRFPVVEPGSEDERDVIRGLLGRGYTLSRIARLLGGRRKETIKRVHIIVGELMSVEHAC